MEKEKIVYKVVTDDVTNEYPFKDREDWFRKLQKEPKSAWIKKRDDANSNYVPIGIQEALADIFFREFDIVENKMEVFANQVIFTVKISCLPNYPYAEHRIISGVAAKNLNTNGKGLEPKAPGTQSSAKSNALTNFGNVFGRMLNRKELPNGFSFVKKIENEVVK